MKSYAKKKKPQKAAPIFVPSPPPQLSTGAVLVAQFETPLLKRYHPPICTTPFE